MAQIAPSTDNMDIIFGNDGAPLPAGSYLNYCEVGTTNLKTIYASNGSTPVSNPVPIVASGRRQYQVTLGAGQYTVYAYRYNGDGIDYSDPLDWSLDHQWVEQGLGTSTSATGTMILADSIGTLRTLGPTDATEVLLEGYYAAGDKPPKIYYWDASYLGADDLGYCIKNPSISTGRWRHKPADIVDIRDYGLIPGASGNAFFASANSAVAFARTAGMQIYVPTGRYDTEGGTWTVNCRSIIDAGATFNPADGVTTIIDFQEQWDIRSTSGLKYASSTGTLTLTFSSDVPQDVKLVWWSRAHADYATGVGNALRAAAATTAAQHTILIDRPYLIDGSLGGSFTVYNPVKFVGTGKIKNGQLAYTVYLNGPITNRTDTTAGTRKAILDASGSSFFRFPQDAKILASWFGNDGSEDCGPALNLISLTSSIGTQFVLDADTYLQNDGAAYGYTAFANLVLVPAGGRLHVPGSTSVIHIPSVTYTEECIFVADPGVIAVDSGKVSPMMWYDSTNPEPSIRSALFSMLHGGRDTVCDLAGRPWTASATVTSTSNYNTRRKICNGTLSSSITDPLIFMASGATFRIHAEDIITTLVGPFVSTQAGVTIVNMSSTRSFISCSASGGSAYSLSGAVYNMDHANSSFSAYSAITGTLATLRMSNCYVSGGMAVTASSIEIIGGGAQNYQNASTTWHLRAPQCTVSGVNITGVNLACLPATVNATPIIAHSITGNTFKWLNPTYGTAYVLAMADAANTRLNGFSVVGNSWISENIAVAGSAPVIAAVTSGGGTYFADRSAHKCKVASNAGVETGSLGSNSYLIIPSTVLTGSFTWSSVINTSTSPDFVEIALPPAAFGIPGVPTYAIGTASGKVVDPAGSVNAHVTYKGYGVDGLNAGGAGILRVYADRALGNPSTTPEDTIYYSATLFGFGG